MRHFPVLLLTFTALMGCRRDEPPAPRTAVPTHAPASEAASSSITGRVLERIDASPYSYLRIQSGQGEIWAAVPETKVEKGAEVTVNNAMQMDGFESKTLKRKFDVIFFGTLTPSAGAPMGAAMQHAEAAKGPADVPDVKVAKASGPGARTVAETYAQKSALNEKPIVIRGKVVKFTAEVMGKNWIHLRDGSGSPERGDNDLTLTTKDTVKVGDVVLVKGTVRINKDFGSGYTYSVIVEDAKVSN